MRKILLVAALVLAAGRVQAYELDRPAHFVLGNGMPVVVIEDHRAPAVTHMVWYRIGAADEPPGKGGIAHFLEHLMFKGTRDVGPGEFQRIVAKSGGRDNAFTSADYTGYHQTVSRDRLEEVMRMEADRMANLSIPEEQVAPEREVVMEERRSRTGNDPAARLYEQAMASLYLAHPYRLPIIGWEHEIRALNRDDAMAFYRTWYAPNNAVLVVAGDVTPDEAKALAEKYYGPIPSRAVPPRVRPQEPPHIAPRRITLTDARARQPAWNRYYLAPSRTAGETKHVYALRVLGQILGGGNTSRLNRRLVVETGLAANAGAYYDLPSIDQTRFGISVTPRPGMQGADELQPVEAAVDAVLAEIVRDGVAADELERAKSGLVAAAIYARDNVMGQARIFGSALITGSSIDDVVSWPTRVGAVTADEVLAAARHVFRVEQSVTTLLLPKPQS